MAVVKFDTFTSLHGGFPGTAPKVYTATTDALAAALVASGSVADKVTNDLLDVFDIVFINYDVDGTPGSGMYRVNGTGGGSLTLLV